MVVSSTADSDRQTHPLSPGTRRPSKSCETSSETAPFSPGDDIAKAPLATFFRSKHIVDAMNYLDPLAGAIGNHEFDYSPYVFRRRTESSSFP
ncbi:hypothetical protein BRC86_09835 [Halobacteriales archaeon QS_3_64_16]|nr:MAG: hypothetical protein BRC86_09835 [Halobacteriales archaeon QS_3_64_16]